MYENDCLDAEHRDPDLPTDIGSGPKGVDDCFARLRDRLDAAAKEQVFDLRLAAKLARARADIADLVDAHAALSDRLNGGRS